MAARNKPRVIRTHRLSSQEIRARDVAARTLVYRVTAVVLVGVGLIVGVFVITGAPRRSTPQPASETVSPPDTPAARSETTVEPPAPPEDDEATPAPIPDEASAERVSADEAARLLGAVLKPSDTLGFELGNAQAAHTADARLSAAQSQGELSTATQVRYAILVALLDQPARAAALATQIEQAGGDTAPYYRTLARHALANREADSALELATALAQRDGSATTAVLLARAFKLHGDLISAAAAVDAAGALDDLSSADALQLGYVYVALERWEELRGLLAGLPRTENESLKFESRLLATILRAVDREPAEALRRLDALAALQPQRYNVLLWRARTLEMLPDHNATRAAYVATTQLDPSRPEALYRHGVFELNMGNPADAIRLLRRAVENTPAYADAWEALGAAALNAGNRRLALESLSQVLRLDPGRATAHFLQAIAYAKAARPEPTLDALRSAIALAPALAGQAWQTEAITTLLAPDVLEAVLGPPPAEPTTTQPAMP